jgi:hypothetical protein
MIVKTSEIKRYVVQDLGKKFEARIEASKAEYHRLEGVCAVLKEEMFKGIESVKTYWTKELHDAAISPEVAKAVFAALDQCGGCARNLIESAAFRMQIENGKVQGLELASADCEAVFKEETKKITAIQEAIEKGTVDPEDAGRPPLRVVGMHPGPGIANQRRAEEETQAAETSPTATPPAETPPTVQAEASSDDPAKKPTGGKKAKPTSAKLFEG